MSSIGQVVSTTFDLVVDQLEADKIDFYDIRATLRDWEKVAKKKKQITKIEKETLFFEKSAHISQKMQEALLPYEEHQKEITIWTCKDKVSKTIQAIAITWEIDLCKIKSWEKVGRYIDIHWLITNPINIRSEVNKEEINRVTGAATRVIAQIAQRALIEKMGLHVPAIKSTIPFFEKLGFVLDTSVMPLEQNVDADLMQISAEELVKKEWIKL